MRHRLRGATRPVASALTVVQATWPGIVIDVSSVPLGGPIEALVSGAASLAVTMAVEIHDPAVELQWIDDVPFRAVAALGHPLAAGSAKGPISREVLSDHLQIVIPDPSERTEGLSFGIGSTNVWRVSDLALKVALIEAGLGWGHLPGHLADPLIASGRLSPILPADTGPDGMSTVPAFLAHRRDQPLGPAAQLFAATFRPA